jgi:hypothetical protein
MLLAEKQQTAHRCLPGVRRAAVPTLLPALFLLRRTAQSQRRGPPAGRARLHSDMQLCSARTRRRNKEEDRPAGELLVALSRPSQKSHPSIISSTPEAMKYPPVIGRLPTMSKSLPSSTGRESSRRLRHSRLAETGVDVLSEIVPSNSSDVRTDSRSTWSQFSAHRSRLGRLAWHRGQRGSREELALLLAQSGRYANVPRQQRIVSALAEAMFATGRLE